MAFVKGINIFIPRRAWKTRGLTGCKLVCIGRTGGTRRVEGCAHGLGVERTWWTGLFDKGTIATVITLEIILRSWVFERVDHMKLYGRPTGGQGYPRSASTDSGEADAQPSKQTKPSGQTEHETPSPYVPLGHDWHASRLVE